MEPTCGEGMQLGFCCEKNWFKFNHLGRSGLVWTDGVRVFRPHTSQLFTFLVSVLNADNYQSLSTFFLSSDNCFLSVPASSNEKLR